MNEKIDPKLVETVARALATANRARVEFWREWTEDAYAALTAIPDSGGWWIAPLFATEHMEEIGGGTTIAQVGDDQYIGASAAARAWIRMRDAYLKDT